MTRVETILWMFIGGIALGAGLATLHAISLGVCRENYIHDLRVHVANLRISYLQEAGKIGDTVTVVDEATSQPANRAA